MEALALHRPLRAAALLTALLAALEVITGCGGAAPCTYTNVASVSPAAANADHRAVVPGDQQQFSAFSQELPTTTSTGCAIPSVIAKLTPTWTVSDSTSVKISSALDATNGLATCIGTTKSAVTVTAVGSLTLGGTAQTLGTATLTCK